MLEFLTSGLLYYDIIFIKIEFMWLHLKPYSQFYFSFAFLHYFDFIIIKLNYHYSFLIALIEDEEDRLSLQQRPPNAGTPTQSQSMRIILEEDENSESPPIE